MLNQKSLTALNLSITSTKGTSVLSQCDQCTKLKLVLKVHANFRLKIKICA